jgi:oligoendopeptidase F
MLVLLASLSLAADDGHTWHLEHIFTTEADYDKTRADAEKAVADLPKCKGTLGKDAKTLLGCLDELYGVAETLGKLHSYASNHSNADQGDDHWQQADGQIQLLQAKFSEASSWFDPELQEVGSEKIEGFLKSEPKLAIYAYPLRSTLRRKAHTLSAGEERLLALASTITDAPNDTYDVFTSSELPWPSFTTPDGKVVVLRQSAYTLLRQDPSPEVRKQVFDTFFTALGAYKGTMGSLMNAQMNAHWFQAQARHYPSSVEAALDGNFLPRTVYDTLVTQTEANLPTLYRYLKLRSKMLGIEKLKYSDLYVPLVAGKHEFSVDESERLAMLAAAPLGKDYVAAMDEGFKGGWIDAYPRDGKLSGAYMSDEAYGVHPFVLLNHNNDYEAATTLMHEFGHAMHSHLTMAHQPYPTANYPTFLAEIASTFHEALLVDYMIANAKTDDDKLYYLGTALEGLRTTYFRQAMFGEFELQMHEKVEHGEPLTGGVLTQMYADLVRRFYGQDQGIVQIDDSWTAEWQYIPHFYYDFYVYQYATSIAASSALEAKVMHKEKGAVDKYLSMLSAGGSDDPAVLLNAAGVDLTKPDAYVAIAQRMNDIMDQMEAILAKKGTPKAPKK